MSPCLFTLIRLSTEEVVDRTMDRKYYTVQMLHELVVIGKSTPGLKPLSCGGRQTRRNVWHVPLSFHAGHRVDRFDNCKMKSQSAKKYIEELVSKRCLAISNT